MSNKQKKSITLKMCEEAKLLINNELSLLILGITDKRSIFMSLNVNNSIYYENLIDVINKDEIIFIFKGISYTIEMNQYKLEYIDNGNKLIFTLDGSGAFWCRIIITLYIKNKTNKIFINNENIMKSLYNFNKKYNRNIQESQVINLYGQLCDEGFKDLSTIKLDIKRLYLEYNDIRNIEPLNSANFKSLQILNIINNKIVDLKYLNNLELDFLVELNLSSNKIIDITPLENVKFNK